MSKAGKGCAGVVVMALMSLGAWQTGYAQAVPPPAAYGPDWNAPRGYGDYYREGNGQANLAARQGYSAGISQGESDSHLGHSYRPTHVDTYKHVPDSPQSVNRNEFKHVYREAFERGYAKGFGR